MLSELSGTNYTQGAFNLFDLFLFFNSVTIAIIAIFFLRCGLCGLLCGGRLVGLPNIKLLTECLLNFLHLIVELLFLRGGQKRFLLSRRIAISRIFIIILRIFGGLII